MTALRTLVADRGPELGMPHDFGSVITGHGQVAQKGIVMDKNMMPYHEQLAMDLENQTKTSMIMSECGKDFSESHGRPFHWCDPVPADILSLVRRTLPNRIKACDLDCRLIAADLIADLKRSKAEAQAAEAADHAIDPAKGAFGPNALSSTERPNPNLP